MSLQGYTSMHSRICHSCQDEIEKRAFTMAIRSISETALLTATLPAFVKKAVGIHVDDK